MTAKQIDRLTHHYGEVLEEFKEEDSVRQKICKIDQERHYAMMDGSMVFIRKEGWKELKLEEYLLNHRVITKKREV